MTRRKISARWTVVSISAPLCVLALAVLSECARRPGGPGLVPASRDLRAAAQYHYLRAYVNAPKHSYGERSAARKVKSACHQLLGDMLSATAAALGEYPQEERLHDTLSDVARWSSRRLAKAPPPRVLGPGPVGGGDRRLVIGRKQGG
jgi:hypothetical protein